jgi:hypothetical protein
MLLAIFLSITAANGIYRTKPGSAQLLPRLCRTYLAGILIVIVLYLVLEALCDLLEGLKLGRLEISRVKDCLRTPGIFSSKRQQTNRIALGAGAGSTRQRKGTFAVSAARNSFF